MPGPRVSVVMPVFNEEAFLSESVESVLAQDYANVELLISDDGSTDGTLSIATGFASRDGRVKVIKGDRNEGKAIAANRALEAASGELIAWLDGDDVMLPGKLSAQVGLLEHRPDAVGCCHDAEVFDSESGRSLGSFTKLYNGRPLREGGVELWFDPTYRHLPSATMFRASARPPHGLDPRLRRANDWLFDIELFRHGVCVVSQEMLVRYRRHEGQLTDPEDRGEWFEEGLMVMAIAEARYPELRRRVRGSRTALLLGEARRRWRAGEYRSAWRRGGEAALAGGVPGLAQVGALVARAARERRRTAGAAQT